MASDPPDKFDPDLALRILADDKRQMRARSAPFFRVWAWLVALVALWNVLVWWLS